MLSRSWPLIGTNNVPNRDNALTRHAAKLLERRLPPGWSAVLTAREPSTSTHTYIILSAPDGTLGRLALLPRQRFAPRDVATSFHSAARPRSEIQEVVVAPFLSPSTRQLLNERQLGYLDLTGNLHVTLSKPGLYLSADGLREDPNPEARPRRSLRGPKVGRILRPLIEHMPAPGVRTLARSSGMDPGYVSRLLAFLDAEALIRRNASGGIEHVDWPALLRRWSLDSVSAGRGKATLYFDPRGTTSTLERLRHTSQRYAISGSHAAARYAPVVASTTLTLWTTDEEALAACLGVRATNDAPNVLIVEADDDHVFYGGSQQEGLEYVAPSQACFDLLSKSGRATAKGEVLLEWMRANERRWRTISGT